MPTQKEFECVTTATLPGWGWLSFERQGQYHTCFTGKASSTARRDAGRPKKLMQTTVKIIEILHRFMNTLLSIYSINLGRIAFGKKSRATILIKLP